jgi:glycosyltransferase involved in cell wall biosynthesis
MDKGSREKRILIINPGPPGQFVFNDLKTLSKWYDVTLFEGWQRCSLKKYIDAVRRSDFILCWFGCRQAAFAVLLAKLFHKKVAVIAGGQDVAYEPEIGYGYMLKRSHRIFIKFAFNHCDVAIAVSRFTAGELLKWAKPKALCLIQNGVMEVHQQLAPQRLKGVICVSRVYMDTIKVKGIECLLKAAKLLPDIPFLLVGEVTEPAYRFLSSHIPPNVYLLGSLSHDAVLRLYPQFQVYVQPSYIESFGLALAEAMSGGCVPIVTRKGALPELVGDCGFYVEYGDYQALADMIKKAMYSELGPRARERIQENFRIDQRVSKLRWLIEALLNGGCIPDDLIYVHPSHKKLITSSISRWINQVRLG